MKVGYKGVFITQTCFPDGKIKFQTTLLFQDAFADFFSDQSAVEDKVWKGLLFTATLGGIGALAAVMAR